MSFRLIDTGEADEETINDEVAGARGLVRCGSPAGRMWRPAGTGGRYRAGDDHVAVDGYRIYDSTCFVNFAVELARQ